MAEEAGPKKSSEHPLSYTGGMTDCKCNDACMPAHVKKGAWPQCPVKAVIPLVEVATEENLKELSNCFVYVQSTNTTYYIDNQSRFIMTYKGMVFRDGYDYETNPLGLRGQIVPDFENKRVIIYNNTGDSMVVGEGGADVESISDADWAALWEGV